jgi:hypothetical protein
MAEATYAKARQAVTVPYQDGRTVPHEAGDVIDLSKTTDAFRAAYNDGPAAELFDKSSKSAFDSGAPVPNSEEQFARARAAAPVEARLGGGSLSQVPLRGDPGRTLPESGNDLAADKKFADGSADTSDAGTSRDAQAAAIGAGLGDPVGGDDDLPNPHDFVQAEKGTEGAAPAKDDASGDDKKSGK